MIEFMVISLPRSGSTWASVWLTTDTTLCLHDPLWDRHYTALDAIRSDKVLGIACTGLCLFHEWLNAHPAKKVILHRDIDEVNASLAAIGLPSLDPKHEHALERIQGHHYNWRDVFDNPREIYEFLLEMPFDAERHAELVKIEMQPNFEGLTINPEITAGLVKQIRSSLCGA